MALVITHLSSSSSSSPRPCSSAHTPAPPLMASSPSSLGSSTSLCLCRGGGLAPCFSSPLTRSGGLNPSPSVPLPWLSGTRGAGGAPSMERGSSPFPGLLLLRVRAGVQRWGERRSGGPGWVLGGMPGHAWPSFPGREGVNGSWGPPTVPPSRPWPEWRRDAAGQGDVECWARVPRLGGRGVTWGWRGDPDAARGGSGCAGGLSAVRPAGKGLEEPVGSSLGCAELS